MILNKPDLSEREMRALERGRQKAELIAWLRGEAAARDGEMAWYVARTRWRADSVASDLRDHGIEAVCPKERRWKRFARATGKRYPVEIPMLGNYLFVRLLKAESAWAGFLTFEGVAALQGMRAGHEVPVPLRDSEMAKILAMLGDAREQPVREARVIGPGDEVVHPFGSMTELRGVVLEIDDAKREALLRTVLFGRELEMRCGIDNLEKL